MIFLFVSITFKLPIKRYVWFLPKIKAANHEYRVVNSERKNNRSIPLIRVSDLQNNRTENSCLNIICLR